jgi:hypothetical protein
MTASYVLSLGDVRTPPLNAITQCLSVVNPANDAPTQILPCIGGSESGDKTGKFVRWVFVPGDNLSVRLEGFELCLDAGSTPGNNGPAKVYECYPGVSQQQCVLHAMVSGKAGDAKARVAGTTPETTASRLRAETNASTALAGTARHRRTRFGICPAFAHTRSPCRIYAVHDREHQPGVDDDRAQLRGDELRAARHDRADYDELRRDKLRDPGRLHGVRDAHRLGPDGHRRRAGANAPDPPGQRRQPREPHLPSRVRPSLTTRVRTQCLAVVDPKPDAPTQFLPCAGAAVPGDETGKFAHWVFIPGDNLSVRLEGFELCLDAGSAPGNNGPAKVYTCYPGLAQQQ